MLDTGSCPALKEFNIVVETNIFRLKSAKVQASILKGHVSTK